MTRRTLAAAAVLSCAAALVSFGQDATGSDEVDAGAFDSSSFDQAVTQSAQPGQAAKTEFLFGGSFLTDNTATTSTSLDWYTVGGSVSGKVFGKLTVPDYGSLYVGYNVSKNMYQGDAGTLPVAASAYLAAPAGSFYTPSFTLSELYYSFDVNKALFVRLGNQLIAWGPSFIWTPVDFINLQRADPLAAIDRRQGKPGIRLHVPLQGSNIFVFTDFSGTVTAAGVQDPLKTAVLSARWDVTLAGAELALTGSWGESVQNRYGFDITGRLLGFDIYGEAAAAFPYGSYDLAWAADAGFQRTLGDLGYWSIAGEFFYNSGGTSDTSEYPAMLMAQTFVPLYVGQYYAYASLSRSHLGVNGVSASVSGLANLSDMSWRARGSLSVAVPNLVPFSIGASYAGGGDGKELTLRAGDGTLSLDLQVRFEF
jgi:hypothetical protein